MQIQKVNNNQTQTNFKAKVELARNLNLDSGFVKRLQSVAGRIGEDTDLLVLGKDEEKRYQIGIYRDGGKTEAAPAAWLMFGNLCETAEKAYAKLYALSRARIEKALS